MTRLARYAITACSAVSMSLCLCVMAVWAASYRVQPTVSWVAPQRLAGAGVARGAVFFGEVRQPPGSLSYFGPPHGRRFLMVRPPMRDTGGPNALTVDWQFAGFVYRQRSPPLTYLHIALPCWPLAAAFAVVPASPPARQPSPVARGLLSHLRVRPPRQPGALSGVRDAQPKAARRAPTARDRRCSYI